MKLNPQQKQAVIHTGSPLLVLAGAGSGKTAVITHKIAWLIDKEGIATDRIYAVTFTNKAAREMKSRAQAMLGKARGQELHTSTFHALGMNIIRREHKALEFKPGFSIFDSEDSLNIVRDLMRSDAVATSSGDRNLPQQVQWKISQWKNALLLPEQVIIQASDPVEALALRVYPDYLRQLRAFNAVDFDDLILLPTLLLRNDPECLYRWQSRIAYLLVDEYQDTNACQYELVKLLTGTRGKLTVVGDDDQSIYAWRGAQPENLALLARDYPDLTVIKLEQNYRSAGRILKAANAVIANNDHVFEKKLWSDRGYGDPIRILPAADEEREAELVVSDIQSQVFRHRRKLSEFVILYRGNHQSRAFEKALRERSINYLLSGGTGFFERSEIKDLMAYLRILCNPDDDAAFLRAVETPRRHIGPATLEKLGQYAGMRHTGLCRAADELGAETVLNTTQMARLRQFTDWLAQLREAIPDTRPVELLKRIVKDIHYEEYLLDTHRDRKATERRMENVNELVEWVGRIEQKEKIDDLYDVVGHLGLLNMLEREDEESGDNAVTLMTLHAAKGLEFPHVYIVGAEENILPHHASQDEAGILEERRLAYVGITRAQHTLTFTYTRVRKRAGEQMDCEPSRFLNELPKDDIEWAGQADEDPQARQARGQAHLDGLRALLGD